MAETEQNKSEEPTPFKLKRARQKGMVARGTDLGFFSAMSGLTLFAVIAGADSVMALAETARQILQISIAGVSHGEQLPALISSSYSAALRPVAILASSIVLVVLVFEIAQVRGLAFSTHPLKPDFGRLNPAKGLKRVFSVRMLKETAKSILKLAAYSGAAAFVIVDATLSAAPTVGDAPTLVKSLQGNAMRLIFIFTFLALIFAVIDQLLARREFQKQMRMSRSELTREVKEREGEPRIKRKRKDLHAAFAKQNEDARGLPGSDMLIVNPEHYAVALSYASGAMNAPEVRAKGRNAFALALKKRAAELSIPIFEAPALARALYRQCNPGEEIPGSEYRGVVELYLKLAASKRRLSTAPDA